MPNFIMPEQQLDPDDYWNPPRKKSYLADEDDERPAPDKDIEKYEKLNWIRDQV